MQKRLRNFLLKNSLIIIMTIFMMISFASVIFADDDVQDDSTSTDQSQINQSNNDDNIKYTEFLKTHDLNKDGFKKEFVLSSIITSNQTLETDSLYKDSFVALASGDVLKFSLNVDEAGLYAIGFDYNFSSASIVTTEASLLINSDIQYYENQQLIFGCEYLSETSFKKDRYGNEILPASTKSNEWNYCLPLQDGSSLHNAPMYVYLKRGINSFDLYLKSGEVNVGNITLFRESSLPTYAEYLEKYHDAKIYDGSLLTYGAEEIYSKSSLDIRIYSLQDSTATRYNTSHKLLNAVYAPSWDNGNQKISYKINVPQSGLYAISFKYLQDTYLNMPVERIIRINGEVPFAEVESYQFYYSKRWKNETLGSDAPYLFYLNEGDNLLSLEVKMDIYRPVIEEIDRIMDEMNELSLEIKSLTNGQTDTYRNWNLTKYIPDLVERLEKWCDEINDIRDYLLGYCSKKKESSTFSSLKVAIKKLKTLEKDPDQIANRLTLFTDGSSSVSQVLGNLLLTLNSSPVGLEKIYLSSPSTHLPRTRANFFVRMIEGIKRFFISFFNKEYSTTKAKDDEIEVWVNRSRQYVEVMQQMVDEAGLKVKFSIMPDQNKLILANSSGDLPDVAVGISNWIPYDLALRGITEDLRGYPGYEDVIKNFAQGALIPYAYEDGMYGVPETQDFWVTFYRSDIYSSLNLEVPSSWNDLVGELPILQRLGYNFYSPLSSYRGLKPYVATLTYFYQWGASGAYSNNFSGSLYSSDGMSTTLSDESYVEALKFMTNLFTIYDVPEETLSFYNSFRYGTMPLGIANSGTYTSLLIAAPEINGNWSIAPHIGFEEGGTTYRYATAGSQGITMFSSSKKKDQAWDFISWWTSTAVQEAFLQRMYGMYGLEYLWYTANMEAFRSLPIDSSHKEVILEQLLNWSMEASRVPAAYMVERSISDAYSKVVFNGANVRIALDDAVIESNREIERKMTEFKYIVDGKKVKDYKIPSIYNITEWLSARGE